jgi:hypothetical protein
VSLNRLRYADNGAMGQHSRVAGGCGSMIRREFSIAEGTILFISAYVLSAGLGIIRQALFNAEFGAGMEASAYYAAFRLPDTIASLISGGGAFQRDDTGVARRAPRRRRHCRAASGEPGGNDTDCRRNADRADLHRVCPLPLCAS